MAQSITPIKKIKISGNKRKTGVFAKTKTSKNKKSANYVKPYAGQGR